MAGVRKSLSPISVTAEEAIGRTIPQLAEAVRTYYI